MKLTVSEFKAIMQETQTLVDKSMSSPLTKQENDRLWVLLGQLEDHINARAKAKVPVIPGINVFSNSVSMLN